jgi:hypothetical protein
VIERCQLLDDTPMRLAHRIDGVVPRQLKRHAFNHQRLLRQVLCILEARQPLFGQLANCVRRSGQRVDGRGADCDHQGGQA